jgi:general secretion pathway protein E
LRQDPDVIMVGEIRDAETAAMAVQSALTGHLVLSTLHTNDALSAFTRLINMGVDPFLVAAPVKAVQAQRLIRKVCQCAIATTVPDEIQSEVERLVAGIEPRWVKAVGCSACGGMGYKGRMGIYEIVPMSQELHDLVVANVPVSQMRALARKQGHRSLYQDGLLKAARGLTTLEEVLRVSNLDAE